MTAGGSYTLSGLGVTNTSFYCTSEAVMAGWALFVVYRQTGLAPRRVELRDGLEAIREGSTTTTLSGFTGAASPSVRLTALVWEGDPDQVGDNTLPERLRWNTTNLTDGSNPTNNTFNSTINSQSRTNVYGMDLDTFTPTLAAGATSATLQVASGPDLVLLQTVMTSIAVTTRRQATTPDGGATTPRLAGTGYSLPFVVTNLGNVDDSYNLTLTGTGTPVIATIDSIRGPGVTPTSATTATVSAIVGQARTITVWYTVVPGDPADNTGTLRATSAAQGTVFDDGFATIRRVRPTLTLAKQVNPQTGLSPGVDVTYTLQFRNVGEFAARGVTVADSVPSQVQFKVGTPTQSLPAGITATVQYSTNGTAWTLVPASGGCGAPAGYDACVRFLRWSLTGDLAANATAPQGTLTYQARVR